MDYMDTTGRVFDIQRYSIHDGPGIRTIVFLKGCVLRCRWCCNPESQEYRIQKMMVQGEEKTIGRDVTVREMLAEVEQDRPYYSRSGGGMTLSGGECLCQPEFTAALLRAAKEHGINTAIESMACAPWEKIETILPWLDRYLMDIKHMNGAKHKEFTGRDNALMLENARKVALSGQTELIIRVPVIPTFNDSVEEIQAIARFAATLPGVRKIHLLPYHRLGQDKYDGLGREYQMREILPPTAEHMDMLKKAVHVVCALDCQIGG
ncbi:MAG: glycyl-radical enzyme activating protein [Clostridiales bacterium]|nr:glycyl-radical enzyme activating protein [Clostridiales bacterium]